jgi:acetylornithine deacetylase/succinyl-diaminopimelate desuccinylase-like protein
MSSTSGDELSRAIRQASRELETEAAELLRECVRVPADWVDRPAESGGDPLCGLSNHEGPRLALLRERLLTLEAVDGPEDAQLDDFGNLHWSLEDTADGIPRQEKTVIWLDGHGDTVAALRQRWHEALAGAVDPYLGLLDAKQLDRERLRRELGYLPPDGGWDQLIWGRGAADQLGGVVCQVLASKVLRSLRPLGALRGVIIRGLVSVAEEDNDGGGPGWVLRRALERGDWEIPDVVILTEGTGCADQGALGIYRGQRGRMQIEVSVVGRSCHGSMPWEGLNPLEHGAAIITEASRRFPEGRGERSDPFLGPASRTPSLASLETPSDCAVPERFTFRFDRRLTSGEDPAAALREVEELEAVAEARRSGLEVEVGVPAYTEPTWRGFRPENLQVYPGWATPEEHPAVRVGIEAYRLVVSPSVETEEEGGSLRREPRLGRWLFSTDGVGLSVAADRAGSRVPAGKRWIVDGPHIHPPMLGFGPGIEQNTHKIGECVDRRELAPVIAFLARFPSLYRRRTAAEVTSSSAGG